MPQIAEDIRKFEEYWKATRDRKPTKAEREAYLLGRIEGMRDAVIVCLERGA